MTSEGPNILVTGGAGFIGSAVCRHLTGAGYRITNVDKLTYAGNLASLKILEGAPNYRFDQVDICNGEAIAAILRRDDIDAIMHLAAESHVDRSIEDASAFVQTNIVGTSRMLDAAVDYWSGLKGAKRDAFRFHHISTDEVFGDLPLEGGLFDEDSSYSPNSPYAASKAAADHLVRAWGRTYGMPVVISNCSNNYGPFQFPEKLIPQTILNAIEGAPVTIYGDGSNVRDWLHVSDHVRALELVVMRGKLGESYNVGGSAERSNLTVVQAICDILDVRRPRKGGASYRDLVVHVADRPGHDRRYGIDGSKVRRELGWSPQWAFVEGLGATVDWYLNNEWWWLPFRAARPAILRSGRAGVPKCGS